VAGGKEPVGKTLLTLVDTVDAVKFDVDPREFVGNAWEFIDDG
jgi:hypothetical protein